MKRVWQPRSVDADEASPAFEQHWVVVCGEETRAHQVEAEIASALPQVRCVVIASGGEGEVARRYEAGVLQVLAVLQRIVQDRPKDDVLIQLAVPASGEAAVFGGLSGLLRTARLEHPRLKSQLVAFEAQEAAQIVAHLQKGARVPDEREVRHVGGEWQVASRHELPPGELPSGSVAEMPWRDGGVYLITGGAGGLGLIFAEEIARRVKDAVVVLVGRSQLDADRRSRLSALEGLGSRIEYRRVDVADGAAVTALIGELRQTYGGVSGVLHAAGVIHDSFLVKKTAEEVATVLAPKVSGVVNLDAATADMTLEFMVLFASVSGSFGNVGQADYAAANAFLDRYAAHRNDLVSRGERFGRTVSIAWPLWRGGGMQIDEALLRQHREAGILPMETASGLQAFYQAYAAQNAEIAVLSGETSRLRALLRQGCRRQGVAS